MACKMKPAVGRLSLASRRLLWRWLLTMLGIPQDIQVMPCSENALLEHKKLEFNKVLAYLLTRIPSVTTSRSSLKTNIYIF